MIQIKYIANSWKPIARHRTLERELKGSYLFGLIKIYRYFWSKWKLL